jgi:hypothetical protein
LVDKKAKRAKWVISSTRITKKFGDCKILSVLFYTGASHRSSEKQDSNRTDIGLSQSAQKNILHPSSPFSLHQQNIYTTTMGGYLTQDPAVEKWVRMRESTAKHFAWNARNVRTVGILGLVIPGALLYLAVATDVR